MRFAIRRNLRVGAHTGTPIEDLGIKPQVIHPMTRNDLLAKNKDLIIEASKILKDKPVRQLEVTISDQSGSLKFELTTLGISRTDIYIDGRPVLSQYVHDGSNELTIGKLDIPPKLIKILGLGRRGCSCEKNKIHSG